MRVLLRCRYGQVTSDLGKAGTHQNRERFDNKKMRSEGDVQPVCAIMW